MIRQLGGVKAALAWSGKTGVLAPPGSLPDAFGTKFKNNHDGTERHESLGGDVRECSMQITHTLVVLATLVVDLSRTSRPMHAFVLADI